MSRRQIFRLGLDQRDGDRLGFGIDGDAQDVIHAAFGPLARFAVNDFDCAGGLLAPNQFFRPATDMNGGINQFGARIGFTEWHEGKVANGWGSSKSCEMSNVTS